MAVCMENEDGQKGLSAALCNREGAIGLQGYCVGGKYWEE